MNSENALSSEEYVLSVATAFFEIADALHKRLNIKEAQKIFENGPNDLYGMLIEEYGLRARAAILRNNADHHIVGDTTVSQERLRECLDAVVKKVPNIFNAAQLRILIASVSMLCVGIVPGKGHVVDFLIGVLEKDLQV